MGWRRGWCSGWRACILDWTCEIQSNWLFTAAARAVIMCLEQSNRGETMHLQPHVQLDGESKLPAYVQIRNQLRRKGVKVCTNTVRRVMEDAGCRPPKVRSHELMSHPTHTSLQKGTRSLACHPYPSRRLREAWVGRSSRAKAESRSGKPERPVKSPGNVGATTASP